MQFVAGRRQKKGWTRLGLGFCYACAEGMGVDMMGFACMCHMEHEEEAIRGGTVDCLSLCLVFSLRSRTCRSRNASPGEFAKGLERSTGQHCACGDGQCTGQAREKPLCGWDSDGFCGFA
jgi:hypothetical protein